MEGKQKKYLHLTSFLCSSLALHSPTVWASFACMYVCHVCTSAGMHKSEHIEKKDTDYFNSFFKDSLKIIWIKGDQSPNFIP